jgi:chromosome partitioning protein
MLVCAEMELQKIIGVCGRKGGSGKTTLAVHVAAELSSKGRNVVLVDADPQGSANHWSHPGALPVRVEHRPLQSGGDARAWSRAIRSLPTELVVIDSAPHLDSGMGATVGISDVVALPCGPSGLDLLALGETIGLVRQIKAARGDSKPVVTIVPTRVDTRTAAGRQLQAVLEAQGENVAPALRLRMALADAFNTGEWVGSFAPDSPAHEDVKAITLHILKLLGEKPGRKR